ncbi:MAG: hypothetical protein IJZ95_02700 [Oscillospiraceae bacterium]|nr:hypothetical protein [Oscillospiraceae bacterium]
MIKGVTKNYIEIRSRNNDAFDKIIVILKDDPIPPDENELIETALLMTAKIPNCIKRNNHSFIYSFLSGLLGSALTAMVIIACFWFV